MREAKRRRARAIASSWAGRFPGTRCLRTPWAGWSQNRYFGILVTYLRDGDKVYETYWTTGCGNELMAPSYGLLDLIVYGRQQFWEGLAAGLAAALGFQRWPFRLDGRPTARWSRIKAGRNDDLAR